MSCVCPPAVALVVSSFFVRRSFAAALAARSRSLERVSHVLLTYSHIKMLEIYYAYSESSTFDEPSTPNHHHHPSSPSDDDVCRRQSSKSASFQRQQKRRQKNPSHANRKFSRWRRREKTSSKRSEIIGRAALIPRYYTII